MTAKEIAADRAEALELLRRALTLMDERGFGGLSAPHIDLGLHLLAREAEQAGDQPSDAR